MMSLPNELVTVSYHLNLFRVGDQLYMDKEIHWPRGRVQFQHMVIYLFYVYIHLFKCAGVKTIHTPIPKLHVFNIDRRSHNSP